MRTLKNIIIFGLSGILLYGCGLVQVARWSNPDWKPDIRADMNEFVAGQFITKLNVRYGMMPSPIMGMPIIGIFDIFLWNKEEMLEISFTIQDNDQPINLVADRVYTIIKKYAGIDHKFIKPDLENFSDGISPRYLYYKAGTPAAIITAKDKSLDILLKCPYACDIEALKDFFEKRPIAFLSPKAIKNWEELKSRFK